MHQNTNYAFDRISGVTPGLRYAIICVLFLLSFDLHAQITVRPPSYKNIIRTQSNFILGNQLQNGAFLMSGNHKDGRAKICPYFANIAASALLEKPVKKHVDAVKRWMIWFTAHLNPDGSIDDYYVDQPGGFEALTSSRDFDSIDSYAATFLTLAAKLCRVSPSDTAWLKQLSPSILRVAEALALVIDDSNNLYNGFSKDNNNGLTVAKPKYKAKYTMDNSEVNEGMRALVWLADHIIPELDIRFWQNALDQNTLAIEKFLWDAPGKRYRMYEGGPPAKWEKFYADATCQLYPIWCKVIDPRSERAKHLWDEFNAAYPDWQYGRTYDKGNYPWAVILYTAAIMQDHQKVKAYMSHLDSYTSRRRFPPNWYNLESAFVILASGHLSGKKAISSETRWR